MLPRFLKQLPGLWRSGLLKIPCKRNLILPANSCILGIETSCDDTGAGVIDSKGHLLGEKLISQTDLTVKFGGVLPTIAAELHKQNIQSVVDSAIQMSSIEWRDLSAIAVTVKPGMPLSLKIGVQYAKQLAKTLKLPVIPVHHMEAHALTAMLTDPGLKFPYLIVLLSGGHGLIAIAQSVDRFILLGKTLDASPGDVLDKIARTLKLSRLGDDRLQSVSGGQAIDLMASLYQGNPRRFELLLPRSQSRDCDFSFSGIHLGAEHLIRKLESGHKESVHETNKMCQDPVMEPSTLIDRQDIADLCATVQYALARLICRRVQRAIEFTQIASQSNDPVLINQDPLTSLVVSGGVGANSVIRTGLTQIAEHYGLRFTAPPPKLCTDNGVMIAWNGYLLSKAGLRLTHDIDSIDFEPRAPFGLDYRSSVIEANLAVEPLKLTKIYAS